MLKKLQGVHWSPTENYHVVLGDETGKDRSQEELDGMVRDIREVANRYGFDISQWAGEASMRRFYKMREEVETT